MGIEKISFNETGNYTSGRMMLLDALQRYPDAESGVVVLFNGAEENMSIFMVASDQQIALASVKLARIANEIER